MVFASITFVLKLRTIFKLKRWVDRQVCGNYLILFPDRNYRTPNFNAYCSGENKQVWWLKTLQFT